MPLPTQAKTAALVAATAVTAAGLNLGVLEIGDDGDATAVELSAGVGDSTSGGESSTSVLEHNEIVSGSVANRASGELQSSTATPAAPSASSSGQSVATMTTGASTSTSTSSITSSSITSTSTSTTVGGSSDDTDDADDADDTDDADDADERSSTSASPAPPATEYLTYEFDGVATIVVALHDGKRLEFWSATPEPGWSFSAEQEGSTEIEVEFLSPNGEDEAEWELKLRDGELRVEQEYD